MADSPLYLLSTLLKYYQDIMAHAQAFSCGLRLALSICKFFSVLRTASAVPLCKCGCRRAMKTALSVLTLDTRSLHNEIGIVISPVSLSLSVSFNDTRTLQDSLCC